MRLLPFAFVLFCSPALAEEVHLVVLHTNDVHGQVLPRPATWLQEEGATSGGLERLAAAVAEVRERAEAEGSHVLVLDGGDWFQGTPEGAVEGGLPFVRALGLVGYDAMAVGNHEFDLGVDHAGRLIAASGLPAVCANVRLRTAPIEAAAGAAAEPVGERADWAPPFRLFERGGLDIAVVGLVAEETPFITHKSARELFFEDPAVELARVIEELPEGIDLILPLTHCGVESDLALARAFPGLPLVVGGHSHTFLRNGVRSEDTLVVQAGHKASALGRVDLRFDAATGELLDASAKLIDLYEEADPARVPPELRTAAADLVAAGEESMGVVVGELLDLGPDSGPFRSMPLGNWMADVMRRATAAHVAMHNRGGIRKRLERGQLTRRDLFEVMPFDNTVVSFEVTGSELNEILRGALDGRTQTKIEVSGVVVEIVVDQGGKASFRRAWIDGRPIDPDGTYRFATNSFLSDGGDGVLRELGERRELNVLDTGTFVREAMERDLSETPRLYLPVENRFLRR